MTEKISKNPPYAQTTVPMERTKADIEKLLKGYGVKGIRWTSMQGQDDVLEFVIDAKIQGVTREIGIMVKPPHIVVKKRTLGQYGRTLANTENINQEYRLLFHWIKSKVEASVWGLSTIENEFLSQVTISLPDGRQSSVGEVVLNLVAENNLKALPFTEGGQPVKQLERKTRIVEGELVRQEP
jgi:hypothetical protein